MSKNIVEKILAKAVGRDEVSPGEYLPRVSSNRPMPKDTDSTFVFDDLRKAGVKKIVDPHNLMIVTGSGGSGHATGKAVGVTRTRIIQGAKEYGVPDENIFDLGRNGIEHVLAHENGWALPGAVYFSMRDGHTTTLGGVGALAIALSNGPVQSWYLASGYTWVRVPEVAKVVLNGSLPKGVFSRDVVEYMISELGPTGTPGQVIEWAGPVVDRMSMDARFTLCSNAIFTGAWTAIVPPDETTINYVKSRTNEAFEPLVSDADVVYPNTFEFELSKLEPQIVPPPHRAPSFPVPKFEGTKISRGFVGSCVNGRIDDLRVAAQILKGKKVHRSVQLTITPGSVNVYSQALREGIMEVLIDAGVCVTSPCCSMCNAHNTPLGDGDVALVTSTCNFPGRIGGNNTDIYLCSPATVVASAVTGKITDPRNYL
ncbi:aconitase family protein [Chloroflexota bacterium]